MRCGCYGDAECMATVRNELTDEAFAAARARGSARSYRELMEHVFAVIEREGGESAP